MVSPQECRSPTSARVNACMARNDKSLAEHSKTLPASCFISSTHPHSDARDLHSRMEVVGGERAVADGRQFGSEFFEMAGAEIREFSNAGMAQTKAAGAEPST